MSETTPAGTVWIPSAERIAAANVTRLGQRLGVLEGHIDGVRSVGRDDPERFWDAVVADLGIPFLRPYDRVLDQSDGPAFARWFEGGEVNLCHACVDRWAVADPDRDALVDEAEDGTVRTLSFAELRDETRRVAGGLLGLGLAPGDRVAILAPMNVEAMTTFLACARAGLVAVPLFSGVTAAGALERIEASGARVLVAAERYVRRGRAIELGALAEDVARAAGIQLVIAGRQRESGALAYDELEGGDRDDAAALPSEHELLYAFTSGTTGRPKAAVHVHAGFLVKVAAEMAYGVDVRPGDRVSWYTELGWIQGPWLLVGALALGATAISYTGAVDAPDAARIWSVAERHRLTALGVSPSLVRATRGAATALVDQLDLSALEAICTAGEVLDDASYEWLLGVTDGRAPVLNMSGGTEVAAMFLSSHPVETLVPGGFGGPALGSPVDVVGPDGKSVRGRPGELVCRGPWPSMTRGFVGDPDRYFATYWERNPGMWTHGDRALVDADGNWFLLGRSDDTLMIAGKRVSPSEYEDILLGHDGVVEACAVGAADAVKGEVAVCLVVPAGGVDEGALRAELLGLLAERLGRMYAPSRLAFVDDLPRTRSNKIVRRTVRAVVAGDTVDTAQLQDAAAVDAVRAAR